MPLYESIFIVRQDVPATQVETIANGFADVLRNSGGQITKTEHWGLRNLAYRINKNKKGHYVLFNVDAPPSAVTEMERTMRINEDVLRFLSIRVDELESGPSAIMRKDERNDRPFGERGAGAERSSDRGRRGRSFDETDVPEGAIS